MGFYKDLSVQTLDLNSLNSLVKANRDRSFRPHAFEELKLTSNQSPLAEDSPEAPQAEAYPEHAPETPEPAPQEIDLETLQAQAHKAGFTEGFAQGYQQGQNEAPPAEDPAQGAARAQLEEAMLLFSDLTKALIDQSEAHHTALRISMERAVLALASELAGQQIAAMPQAFVGKIEDLVDRVGKSVAGTQIYLNAEDLAVVEPELARAAGLEGCELHADTRLSRGAVDIRSGPNRVQSALPEVDAPRVDPHAQAEAALTLDPAPVDPVLTETLLDPAVAPPSPPPSPLSVPHSDPLSEEAI